MSKRILAYSVLMFVGGLSLSCALGADSPKESSAYFIGLMMGAMACASFFVLFSRT